MGFNVNDRKTVWKVEPSTAKSLTAKKIVNNSRRPFGIFPVYSAIVPPITFEVEKDVLCSLYIVFAARDVTPGTDCVFHTAFRLNRPSRVGRGAADCGERGEACRSFCERSEVLTKTRRKF
jgi:hypothetical protein